MTIQVVILAAGQGTRMFSKLPKVLHPIAGKPLLRHVLERAHAVSTEKPIVIYGHGGEQVKALACDKTIWVEQKEQLGTGHAVQQALPEIKNNTQVLILYGDVPFTRVVTLQQFIKDTPQNGIGVLTAHLDNPFGYGRIKRDGQNNIIGIVEQKDATDEEKKINEVNSGIYLVPATYLKKWLPELKNNNAQGEYYLTDIVSRAVAENITIQNTQPLSVSEILGVNNRMQQADMERKYQRQQAEELMKQGVTLLDPNRFDVRGEVTVGKDVTIDVNVILEGKVVIGDNCYIGPNCILKNITLANGVQVKANCVLEDSIVGDECQLGPFTRLRPGAELKPRVHLGNFVEVKKSVLHEGAKAGHLAYIGDADVGKNVNVGAGMITCNYDGANKHKTIIGDNAFIGTNVSLVAPVTIGKDATIGAGSVIAKDAPQGQLTFERAQQISKPDWKRPVKK